MMISHLSVLAKNFYAGCPSCRNPPHLSGLGTGIKRHKKVPPMAGLVARWPHSTDKELLLGIVRSDCIFAVSDDVVHSAEPALTVGVTW